MPSPKTAYCYSRFSTQAQAKGNSEDRQSDSHAAWLRQHPEFVLAADSHYKDLGKSGRGQHLKGDLGRFLAVVEEGKIKPGSVLLIEHLDRLGRMPAYRQFCLFADIVNAGIGIVTTMDGKEFTEELLNSPRGFELFTGAANTMDGAYHESAKKAVRSGDNWVRIRNEAKRRVGTLRLPAWLRASADRKTIETIPERAEIVLKIFKLTLAGWGKDRIAKHLIEIGTEPWGKGNQKGRCWHDSYVSKILSNPAVVGAFQWQSLRICKTTGKKIRSPIGEVIPDYFPPVVPQALFDKIRVIREGREKRKGRVGLEARNLFTGLAWCGATGFPMNFDNKKPWFYLKSGAPKASVPKHINLRPWAYEEFETAFFDFIGRLSAENLVDQIDIPQIEAKKEQIAKQRAEVERLSSKIKNLIKIASEGDLKELPELQDQLSEIRTQREQASNHLKSLESDLNGMTVAVEDTAKTLEGILLIRDKRRDPAFRLRLRDELAALIEGVFVYLDGSEFVDRSVAFKASDLSNAYQAGGWDGVNQLGDRIRHSNMADLRKRRVRLRGFVVVFRDGSCRRVIVKVEPDMPMHADRYSGRAQVVRVGKLARLVDLAVTRDRIYNIEGDLNLGRVDFESDEAFLKFIKSSFVSTHYPPLKPSKRAEPRAPVKKKVKSPA